MYIVLKKTLKGILCVRLDNRKVYRTAGPRTNYFQRFFFSFNKKFKKKLAYKDFFLFLSKINSIKFKFNLNICYKNESEIF